MIISKNPILTKTKKKNVCFIYFQSLVYNNIIDDCRQIMSKLNTDSE